jgi:hypothetical protein
MKTKPTSKTKTKAKPVIKKVAKKKEKYIKVDPSKITKEFDAIFKKYNINKGFMVLEFRVGENQYNTLGIGHDTSLKHDGELKFAQAALNLIAEIGLEAESMEIVTDILKHAKESNEPKSKYDLKIQEKEKSLSDEDKIKLQEIRDQKNKFAKLKQWEKAAKWRDEELKFLKVK